MDEKLLRSEEVAVFALRKLYTAYGYSYFKMSKFEEYDFYADNRDFLASDGIISFTDGGKLLALKPDVTLSIIKNADSRETKKLYYNETVYRRSKETGTIKELVQVGLECVGAITTNDSVEVIELAVTSLAALSNEYALDISHLGLVEAVFDDIGLTAAEKKAATSLLASKNTHDLTAMLSAYPEQKVKLLLSVLDCSGSIGAALEKLQGLPLPPAAQCAVKELNTITLALDGIGMADKINLDFSVISDAGYYSGIVFKGFIMGVPTSVLSGGRYDKLMKKLCGGGGAIGFAVYLDQLPWVDTTNLGERVLLITGEADAPTAIKNAAILRKDYQSVRVSDKLVAGKFDKIFRIENGGVVEND